MMNVQNALRNGNEFEAIQAVELIKTELANPEIFKEVCRSYILSEIEPVAKRCGELLGTQGRFKAHAMHVTGQLQ